MCFVFCHAYLREGMDSFITQEQANAHSQSCDDVIYTRYTGGIEAQYLQIGKRPLVDRAHHHPYEGDYDICEKG